MGKAPTKGTAWGKYGEPDGSESENAGDLRKRPSEYRLIGFQLLACHMLGLTPPN